MTTNVLVCGATGFIGRNIAEHLCRLEGLTVYGTHRKRTALPDPRIRPVRADLTDSRQVHAALEGMDVVIQAAATTSGARDIVGRPYIHVTENAVMNSLVLRAAYEHTVKHLIFLSCSVMYPSSERPLKEADFDPGARIHPSYFGVGWTKVYIEKMCEFYAGLGRTRHTVIRHSNVYGPYDKYDLERSHVFGATVAKAMENTTGKITVWGTGEEARDLLYVGDLVDFIDRVLHRKHSNFELVNVGSGQALPINALVRKIVEQSGKAIRIEHDLSQPTIPTSLCLDTSAAKELFGWTPATTIDEGIARTLAWYREHHADAKRAQAHGKRGRLSIP